MRTPVLIAGATIFALIFAPRPHALRHAAARRGAAPLAGLAPHVEASAAVAFLTPGRGTARPTSGFRIESFLLAIPLLSVASSTSAFQVAVSLASLALVTLAAKRAAVATVRWIDDADEDVGRETSTWRRAPRVRGLPGGTSDRRASARGDDRALAEQRGRDRLCDLGCGTRTPDLPRAARERAVDAPGEVGLARGGRCRSPAA